MPFYYKTLSAGVLAGAMAIGSFQPAAAAPLMMMNPGNTQSATSNVEPVQYRRWHRGPGWRHRGWHHRRHGYYGNGAAALGGLAAGAIIGGAIANSQARASDADAYCSQRFKSYDPASGTYLGYDGNRHACP
ncbi:MAG: BA14K family protein [Pseudomonadota bacterium]